MDAQEERDGEREEMKHHQLLWTTVEMKSEQNAREREPRNVDFKEHCDKANTQRWERCNPLTFVF
ncbi:hypothetical protein KP509_23G033500 [Ceratopteris richardii]|uniref:Uncharacterized protein n=1 Tax=Ceratopteris richardii TaxID=49495 RepID=A0A8T2S166_CERRI|nr:hypothetical protein KP509_23G033500 [Ceratopteris richardii]